MKRIAVIAAVGTLGALGIASPSFSTNQVLTNKFANGTPLIRTCTKNGATIGTVTYAGPKEMWPPNHKLVAAPITAQDAKTTAAGGRVTSFTTSSAITDLAGGEGTGDPHNDPDVSFSPSADAGVTGSTSNSNGNSAVITASLRSERAGGGDGRTYTIYWKATFSGGSCTSTDTETSDSAHDGNGNADTAKPGYATSTDDDPFFIFVPHDMRGGAAWK